METKATIVAENMEAKTITAVANLEVIFVDDNDAGETEAATAVNITSVDSALQVETVTATIDVKTETTAATHQSEDSGRYHQRQHGD